MLYRDFIPPMAQRKYGDTAQRQPVIAGRPSPLLCRLPVRALQMIPPVCHLVGKSAFRAAHPRGIPPGFCGQPCLIAVLRALKSCPELRAHPIPPVRRRADFGIPLVFRPGVLGTQAVEVQISIDPFRKNKSVGQDAGKKFLYLVDIFRCNAL